MHTLKEIYEELEDGKTCYLETTRGLHEVVLGGQHDNKCLKFKQSFLYVPFNEVQSNVGITKDFLEAGVIEGCICPDCKEAITYIKLEHLRSGKSSVNSNTEIEPDIMISIHGIKRYLFESEADHCYHIYSYNHREQMFDIYHRNFSIDKDLVQVIEHV